MAGAFDAAAFDAIAFDDSPLAPTIPGVGPAGAATFVLSLQDGFVVSLAWTTAIARSYTGLEWRSTHRGAPRVRYHGVARLLRGEVRTVRTAVVANAAAGATFLLALPHEELTVAADVTGPTLAVYSTAHCDWAQPGQRAVVVGIDGKTVVAAIVQSTTSTTVTLDVTPTGAAMKAGARLLPAAAVDLDGDQKTARYPVHADDWTIQAVQTLYGWGGLDVMGAGVTLTTFDGLYVWDRGLAIDGTASEGFQSGAELLDLGNVLSSYGAAPAVDWTKTVKFAGHVGDDLLQFLKAFLFAVRGAAVAWLLPSHHDDLIYVSVPSAGTIKVLGPPTDGAGNYATWWTASPAHRRIAVTKIDGTVQYAKVILAPTDNGDGTLTLTLSVVLTGMPHKVSFLELARFADGGDGEEEVFEIVFAGGTWAFEHDAIVVQQ